MLEVATGPVAQQPSATVADCWIEFTAGSDSFVSCPHHEQEGMGASVLVLIQLSVYAACSVPAPDCRRFVCNAPVFFVAHFPCVRKMSKTRIGSTLLFEPTHRPQQPTRLSAKVWATSRVWHDYFCNDLVCM